MLINNAYDMWAKDNPMMTNLANQLESPLVVLVKVEASICLMNSTSCNIAMNRGYWHANS